MAASGNACVVILAAGESRRLGRPKQTLIVDGETLLDRAVATANRSGSQQTVVVLGAYAEQIRAGCRLDRCRTVVNHEWNEGMASSIRAGINAVDSAEGAVIMTCDMPHVDHEYLQKLLQAGELTASRFPDGRHGVPAYFPKSFFPALKALRGPEGAKTLLHNAGTIDLASAALDVDTSEDFTRFLNAVRAR